MSIAWGTVQTAAVTALAVTLVIEYAAKPQLEARKDRHLEALRTRRRFEALLLDVAVSAQVLLEDDTPADKYPIVRAKLQAERSRHYDRLQALITELVDHLGRFAAAYPHVAGMQDDMMRFGSTMRAITLSARSRRRQVELVAELTDLANRVYCQGLGKVFDLADARKPLRARVKEIQQRPAEGQEEAAPGDT